MPDALEAQAFRQRDRADVLLIDDRRHPLRADRAEDETDHPLRSFGRKPVATVAGEFEPPEFGGTRLGCDRAQVNGDIADDFAVELDGEGEEVTGLQQHRVPGAVTQVCERLVPVALRPVQVVPDARIGFDREPRIRIVHPVGAQHEPRSADDRGGHRCLQRRAPEQSRPVQTGDDHVRPPFFPIDVPQWWVSKSAECEVAAMRGLCDQVRDMRKLEGSRGTAWL